MENQNRVSMKVFTERQISLATFIGGPLASAILISKNYKNFNEEVAAKKSIYIGILATIILSCSLYFIPYSLLEKIPGQLIPFIYTGVVYIVIRICQKEKIDNFLKENGEKESYWKTIGVGLLSMIAFAIVLIFAFYVRPIYDGDVLKVGKAESEIYYDSEIPKYYIVKYAEVLRETGFFDDTNQAVIQIRREQKNLYHMYVGIIDEYWNDKQVMDELVLLGEKMQEKTPGIKMNVSIILEKLGKTETKKIK